MEGYGWFPNVIFHDKDEPKKQYAIDFWFKPEGQDLKLMEDMRLRVTNFCDCPRRRGCPCAYASRDRS